MTGVGVFGEGTAEPVTAAGGADAGSVPSAAHLAGWYPDPKRPGFLLDPERPGWARTPDGRWWSQRDIDTQRVIRDTAGRVLRLEAPHA